jgi:hypothetical protein
MAWNPDRSEWLPPSLCSFDPISIGAIGTAWRWPLAPPTAAPAARSRWHPWRIGLARPPAAAGGGTGLSLGTALPLAGTAIGAGTPDGTLTRPRRPAAAASQSAALQAKSAADRVQANQEAAFAQRQALTERRKQELVLSRSRALAAAGGGEATDPSTLTLEGNIAGQGEYNALSNLAAGQTKEAALNYQSDIDLMQAGRYRQAGGIGSQAALYGGLGTLSTSLANSRVLFPRYGRSGYDY